MEHIFERDNVEELKPEPNIFHNLLLYTTPTWYHNLNSQVAVFSDFEKIPAWVKDQIDLEIKYSTPLMAKADAAFQLHHKGWVDVNPENVWKPELFVVKPVDRYTFIRRFYKKHWVWYVLFRRLIAFHNPILELDAFSKTSNVIRVDLFSNPLDTGDFQSFDIYSNTNPMGVSIIIPTLNRYKFIKEVLNDLVVQTYPVYEVIVVDQSDSFVASTYQGYNFPIQVIQQKEKKLWHARNRAIKEAKYDLCLFFDDDSRVEADWIEMHVKALLYFNADISAGVSLSMIGQKIPENYGYFRFADQFDSGNALVKKSAFQVTGLFDEQFEKMRMGDGEFGLRALLNGARSISNHHAKRIHLKVGEGGLRQMGSWDAFRSRKWFAPKPIPSVVYFYRRYFPKRNVREAIFLGVIMSLNSYKYKSNKAMTLASIIISFLFFPLFVFQVWRSWKIASKMLEQGARIPEY